MITPSARDALAPFGNVFVKNLSGKEKSKDAVSQQNFRPYRLFSRKEVSDLPQMTRGLRGSQEV